MPNTPDYQRALNALNYYAANVLGLRLGIARAEFRPDGDWPAGSFHYLFRVERADGTVLRQGFYSMGPGHGRTLPSLGGTLPPPKPSLGDILGSLALDASSYDSTPDLGEFLHEFGYVDDGPSVSAGIDAFAACQTTYRALRSLGDGPYDTITALAHRI